MTLTPPILEPTKLSYESFVQLLPFFFIEVKEDFILLEKSFETKDIDTIRLLTHKMKGSSASYGATNVSEKARLLQSMIDSGKTHSMKEEIIALGKTIEEAYHYSRERFGIS